MGGYGSGRWYWHTKKRTVEQCTTISVSELARDDFLSAGVKHTGSVTWSNWHSGKTVASIGVEVNTLNVEAARLRFDYSVNDVPVTYDVPLETRPCNFGGVRWYAVCPLCRESRVTKLHLPPGRMRFGCRSCHDLTYKSCQESDKRLSRLRNMGPLGLLEAMNRGEVDLLLGLKALPDWVWR